MEATPPRPPEPAAARPRRWIRALFSLLVAALALAALEGALALLGVPVAHQAAWEGAEDSTGSMVPFQLLNTGIYEPDPSLLWRLRRSTGFPVADGAFFPAHTNAAGLRGPELPAPGRDPAEIRVLCLGDSVTFGIWLTEAQNYPAALERSLGAAFPERRVRVINAGIPGHSIVQGTRLFEELRPLRPDAVVLWYGANDAKPAMGVPDREWSARPSPLAPAAAALRGLRTYRCVEAMVRPADEGTRRVSPEDERACVASLRAAAARDGMATVFVRGPALFDLKEAQLRRILEAARKAGAGLVEASERCLGPYAPGNPVGESLVGVRELPEGRLAEFVRVPGDPGLRMSTDRLAACLEILHAWRAGYDAFLAALPEDSLGPAAVLGDTPPVQAFTDNVHLTPVGAAAAGRNIADALAEALRRRAR